MEQLTTTIRFTCPAFLGDARQAGAWRAPPFKAQLRRWWRLVMAASGRDWTEIRRVEGELFGDAAGGSGSRSLVRLRLAEWRPGRLKQWSPEGTSRGMTISAGGQSVAADLYLGFGRLEYGGRGNPNSALAGEKPAIDAGEAMEMRLAWPAAAPGAASIPGALGLIDRLGTLGGRSRNGWGSCVLEGAPGVTLGDFAVDWRPAVDDDVWARGVGRDDRGLLVWQTPARRKWEGVIRELGQIRKDVCRESPERVLLSYPAQKKSIPGWTGGARIPNSLRFKVIPDEGGGLRGLIFHMPCRPPDRLWQEIPAAMRRRFPDVWAAAHEYLDEHRELERVNQ